MSSENVSERLAAADEVSAKVQRGPESIAWFYVLLAIALSFEGTVIQLLPFFWRWKLFLYVLAFGITWIVFLTGWVQERLVSFYNWHGERFL